MLGLFLFLTPMAFVIVIRNRSTTEIKLQPVAGLWYNLYVVLEMLLACHHFQCNPVLIYTSTYMFLEAKGVRLWTIRAHVTDS